MSVTVRPAPARTDVPAGTTVLVRRTGRLVAGGALLWAAAMTVANPQSTDNTGILINNLGGLPFQIGLFALVTTLLRTTAA